MTLSLLSAIVPITNMAGKLGFLKSWLEESSRYDLQVILVHDYRDLETKIELELIVNNLVLPRLKLVHGEFGNPGKARNIGLELATGDWIAFWDSDDLPQLANIFSRMEEKYLSADVLIGRYQVFNVQDQSIQYSDAIAPNMSSVEINPGIWRMIFWRSSIADSRFPSLRMGEDQVFLSSIKLSELSKKFYPEVFYQYNVGNSFQLTNSNSAMFDLPVATKLILEHATKSTKRLRNFQLRLVSRQQLTFIRKSKGFDRWRVMMTVSNINFTDFLKLLPGLCIAHLSIWVTLMQKRLHL